MDYYIKFIRCTSSNNFLPKDSDQFKYLFLLKAKKCGLKLFLGELLEILNELESLCFRAVIGRILFFIH
jgi:hypothetical protein